MVLDLVFDGFLCISMVCIIQNPKIPGSYPISGNIKQTRQFLSKMGPETLNCDIWYFTFLNRSQEPNDLET